MSCRKLEVQPALLSLLLTKIIMSTETTAVAKADKEMEFVPFGGKDPIKLSIAIVRRLIAVPTATGKLPSDDDCIKFMMMSKARLLNAFEGDAFLIGYDTKDGAKFSLITAHQAFLKRAELNPEYNGMKSGVMVMHDGKLCESEGDFMFDDDVLVGGWACVYFKNREHPMLKKVNLKRFNTGRSIWAKDPAGMIVKVAEADALRSSFPTMLGGMYLREELDAQEPAKEMRAPIFSGAVTDVPPPARISEQNPVAIVRKLCEDSGIDEPTLITFMRDIGTADDNHSTLEQVHEAYDQAMQMVIGNWPDFSARIKGTETMP